MPAKKPAPKAQPVKGIGGKPIEEPAEDATPEPLPPSPLEAAAADLGQFSEESDPSVPPPPEDATPPDAIEPDDLKVVAEGKLATAGLVGVNEQQAPVPPVPQAPMGAYPAVAAQTSMTGPWGGPFSENTIVTTPYGDFGCPAGNELFVELRLEWNKKDSEWMWNPYPKHEKVKNWVDPRHIPSMNPKGKPYTKRQLEAEQAKVVKKAEAAAAKK